MYYAGRRRVFQWVVPPEQAFAEMYDEYLLRLRAALLAIARYRAAEIETWMKINAPWTDRTGNARAALHVFVSETLTSIAIILRGDVYYQMFLELRNAGKYAIIAPAIDRFAPLIMGDMAAILR